MIASELIRSIANKKEQRDFYLHLALQDSCARLEIVRQMGLHANINVYYPCFEIVNAASSQNPSLFYPFWSEFAGLLKHENSYKREFGAILLTNLISIDEQDQFAQVFEDYFALLQDKKFMTALCCVRNSRKIYLSKPVFRSFILNLLLNLEKNTPYPPKQVELMKFDVLKLLEDADPAIIGEENVARFIFNCSHSLSPKTQKKAKEMLRAQSEK